ncbi:hypothetical protein BJ742DRAFT_805463 [Cladochytrium replicatum]|nr:hypothetical protein BJ742DRAFT_805463 [Cladochytrium replicatum]
MSPSHILIPQLMDSFKSWDHTSGLLLNTNTAHTSVELPPTPCSDWECSSPSTNPSLQPSPAPSLTAPISVDPGFAFCAGGLSPSSPLPFVSAPSLLLDQAFEMAGPYNYNNHDQSGNHSFSFAPKQELIGEQQHQQQQQQQQHQHQHYQQRQLPELLLPVTYIPHQLPNMEFQQVQFDLGINTNTTGLIPYTVSHIPMCQLSPLPLTPQFQSNGLFTPSVAPVPSHASGHPGTPDLVNYVDTMFSFSGDLALHNQQPTSFSMSLPEPLPLPLHTSTLHHLQLPHVPPISTSPALSSSLLLPHINFDFIPSASPSTSTHFNTVLQSPPQIIIEPPSTMATPFLKHEQPPNSPFAAPVITNHEPAPTPSAQHEARSVSPALKTIEEDDFTHDHHDHEHEHDVSSASPTPPPAPTRRRRRAVTKQSSIASASSSSAAASSAPRMYTCPYVARGKCTRQPFSRLYNLRVHMDVHRPERRRRFACDTCMRSYFRVNELRRHVRKTGHDATAAFAEQEEDEEVEEEDVVKFEEDDEEEDYEEEVVVPVKGKSRTGRARRSKDGDGSASPTCWP